VTTPAQTGWSFLSFGFPVSALSGDTGATGGDVWQIRGGLANNRIDLGGESTGGGIVFAVGNPAGFVINGVFPPQFGYMVNYTDGSSDGPFEMMSTVTFSIPAGKTVKSITSAPGCTIDDGLGNSGEIYIGRASGTGPVSLQFTATGPGNYTLARRAAVGGFVPIGSYAEFQLIRTRLGSGYASDKYKQEADLDLLGKTGTDPIGANSDDQNWVPIGDDSSQFQGTFDGGGKEISNLYINRTGTNYVGLFGYVGSGGIIKDVRIRSGDVSGYYFTGGVAGYTNGGTITDCSNAGDVSGYYYVGGVAGRNGGTSTGCSNAGDVSETTCVGGVVGLNGGTITACYNTGTVSGNSGVGGVAGYNNGTITGCYNAGDVSGGSYIGGVAGTNTGSAGITACYWLNTTAGVDIGYNSGFVTNVASFTSGSFPNLSASPVAEWGTGSGGTNGWWKTGTTDGGSVLPQLWFEP
jgi:hypothetical protein